MEIFGIELPALDSISSIVTVILIVIVTIILFRIFKAIITILLFFVFLFIAYITNPTKESHIEAVKAKAESKQLIIRESSIKVEDYVIVSLTRAGEEEKLIGIGAFTQIWIFGDLKAIYRHKQVSVLVNP